MNRIDIKKLLPLPPAQFTIGFVSRKGNIKQRVVEVFHSSLHYPTLCDGD
jgi:hypothetical protein